MITEKQFRAFYPASTLIMLMVFLCGPALLCLAGPKPDVDEILSRLEARYEGVCVATRFVQSSTLEVMDITDTAAGQAFFKPPGMMRWEYEQPVVQQIITDGSRLWIFKPEENQVVTGKTPSLFGEDSGVNFFARIDSIRRLFDVSPAVERNRSGYRVLKLVPKEKLSDISVVYITISTPDHDLVEIETVNPYGDKTIISFLDIRITREMDEALFVFNIPLDADVIHLGEQP